MICLVKMKLVNLSNTFAVLLLLIFLFFLSTRHCYYIFSDLLSNRFSSCGCICVFWSVLHFLVQFFIFFFVNSLELLSNIGIDLLSGITSRTNKWIESWPESLKNNNWQKFLFNSLYLMVHDDCKVNFSINRTSSIHAFLSFRLCYHGLSVAFSST